MGRRSRGTEPVRRTVLLALVVMGVVAAPRGYGAGGANPPAPGRLKIGFELTAQGVTQREEMGRAIRAHLAGRASSVEPAAVVLEGCEEVVFCVSVIAAPVRIGRTEGGMAVASYVTRRLIDHPQWPWPPPAKAEESSPVVIENAFTVGGKLECASCERALEDLRDTVDTVKAITRNTMVDEGDLNLVVGPTDAAFINEVASDLATRFVEQHLKPWLEQRQHSPS
jgi:hypothetical protein